MVVNKETAASPQQDERKSVKFIHKYLYLGGLNMWSVQRYRGWSKESRASRNRRITDRARRVRAGLMTRLQRFEMLPR
ncbi:hypothetical protein ACTXT7_011903 [Hymenolepis weldensis]